VAGTDPHDGIAARFPGALSAECDGHGFVELTVKDDDRRSEDGTRVVSARCPVCAGQRVEAGLASFVPVRFRDQVDVPPEIAGWAAAGTSAQGLYLAGPVGTGKTHAAWMAVGMWCRATGVVPRDEDRQEDYQGGRRFRPTVIFTRMTDLLDDLRPGDDARQRARDCQEADLLVLDDLGAEKASEWTQERLYSIVDDRYARCAPLIVTGNLPPGVLAGQTGDRVASRLAEMCQVVPMTGADRRRAA
jgi:DNA replication protein DnaC